MVDVLYQLVLSKYSKFLMVFSNNVLIYILLSMGILMFTLFEEFEKSWLH